ncbi:trypsin-like serine protease [Aquincola sp. S2]|uniref:Trypsin-like serine protease n=1 Tax=Pseudaquabacterium terrae TaxID=2732868 RepID=A0ABX2E9T2_9BURK|nr:trypsin-like serine protease [Aquabacterium terrae]NRF65780.1 trypsin-like serine protease [Aquabacterium terrae]
MISIRRLHTLPAATFSGCPRHKEENRMATSRTRIPAAVGVRGDPIPAADSSGPGLAAAIAAAEREAGADDALFLHQLEQRLRAGPGNRSAAPPTARSRTIRIVPATPPNRSFEVLKDPRYLANMRQLMHRTGGGERVVGGQPVKAGEFLDCVAVGSDTDWACTGTLIAPNVVLTAGHCAEFATRVYFGNDVSRPGKVVKVKQRVRHPKYHQGATNDLLVLLLQQNVTTVKPRALATKALADKATDGRVVGFGTVNAGGDLGYGIKRFVDVPVVSNACRGKLDGKQDRFSYGCDPGQELVAGRPMLERDSCRGDSGGPFYVLNAQSAWVLAGATSRATSSAMSTCGDGGIYERVDRFRDWIASLAGVVLP